MRADPFTRFVARRFDEKRTLKCHRKVIFHLFVGNYPLSQIYLKFTYK